MRKTIKLFTTTILTLAMVPAIAVHAGANQHLTGYEGSYFHPIEPEGRSWMGEELTINEITDEYISFDFEYPHSGHATVYGEEKARFTGDYTASANGTVAYGDTPNNTNPIKYYFTFSDNNIKLQIGDDGDWVVNFPSNGTIIKSKPIRVTLNGTEISFDQPPVMVNDRVLVPVRAIFEAMGYTVSWNDAEKTAEASRGNDKITIRIDDSTVNYTVGGVAGAYTCDVPPQIISGRTLVPVRAIAESAGCNVDWDGGNQTVIITAGTPAASGGAEGLTGWWFYYNDEEYMQHFSQNVYFGEDGTYQSSTWREKTEGTYTVDGNKITVNYDLYFNAAGSPEYVYDSSGVRTYELDSGTLVYTSDTMNGNTYEYNIRFVHKDSYTDYNSYK